jgi:hypothetical protein
MASFGGGGRKQGGGGPLVATNDEAAETTPEPEVKFVDIRGSCFAFLQPFSPSSWLYLTFHVLMLTKPNWYVIDETRDAILATAKQTFLLKKKVPNHSIVHTYAYRLPEQ